MFNDMAEGKKKVNGKLFDSERARAAGRANAGKKKRMAQGVQEVWKAAFDKLQDDKDNNLVAWATSNKHNLTDFYRLSTKLIPAKLIAEVESKVNIDLTKLSDQELKELADLYDNGSTES